MVAVIRITFHGSTFLDFEYYMRNFHFEYIRILLFNWADYWNNFPVSCVRVVFLDPKTLRRRRSLTPSIEKLLPQ